MVQPGERWTLPVLFTQDTLCINEYMFFNPDMWKELVRGQAVQQQQQYQVIGQIMIIVNLLVKRGTFSAFPSAKNIQ